MNKLEDNGEIIKNKLICNNDSYYYEKIPELSRIICNSTDINKIEKIYLFGSYAYGNPDEESDLDICVVMKDGVRTKWEYVDIKKTLYENGIIFCDLLVCEKQYFYSSKNPDSVINTIIKKGIILYDKNI